MVKSKAQGSPVCHNFLTNTTFAEHPSHKGMQDFNWNSGVWLAGVDFPHPSYVLLSLVITLDKHIPRTWVTCKLPLSVFAWKTIKSIERSKLKKLNFDMSELRGYCWREQSLGLRCWALKSPGQTSEMDRQAPRCPAWARGADQLWPNCPSAAGISPLISLC